jgi:hypothetical protein
MIRHYRDYFWEKGSPRGLEAVEPLPGLKSVKLISDPYHKHLSIEEYTGETFNRLIYDSRLLDFRHLTPAHQMAWQKEKIEETADQTICLIRNQDDRLLYREVYHFQEKLCRECQIYSLHNLLLSRQKIFYACFGDPFNGIELYDSNSHLVMTKRYAVDEESQFTDLLEENWSPSTLESVPTS